MDARTRRILVRAAMKSGADRPGLDLLQQLMGEKPRPKNPVRKTQPPKGGGASAPAEAVARRLS